MKFFQRLLVCAFVAALFGCTSAPQPCWSIALHGGAGEMTRDNLSPDEFAVYQVELSKALDIGTQILQSGGTSLDAVEQTIRYLEDCPLFNAGKGAVFTHDGRNELDASIMNGQTLEAGAVAGVRNVKNPISLARKVMEQSPHVMLSGDGALEFARHTGQQIVDSSYFVTEKSWRALQQMLAKEKFGTVGCVALDLQGNLSAGTSTGGMTNKRWGRIGDSPIIGAGTYANNRSCAISATGHGEYFIRYTVAADISALMLYKGMELSDAVKLVVHNKLVDACGSGGVIAVDRQGNVSLETNTSGMFRAYAKSNGERRIAVFAN